MITFGSVCSGIECASVAWNPLGWKAAFFSEIEPFPCALLAHHYPTVPNYGDLNAFRDWPDAGVDLLVGGTPCQSFSVAGLRGGMADPRGNLALVYLALADRYRPRWIVWENVPGVLSSNGGRDFGAFLGGLAQLGYGWAYRILDAQFFGVPQRRRRVFVVGYLGDWRRAAAVLFEPASLRWDSPPSREAQKGIANALTERPDRGGGNSEGQRLVAATLTRGAESSGKGGYAGRRREDDENLVAPTISARTRGGGGLGTDFDCDGGLIAFGGNNCSGPIEVAAALQAHGGPNGRTDFGSETFITHSLRADGFDASGAFERVETARGLTTSADRTRSAPIVGCDVYNGDEMGDTAATLNAASGVPNHSGPKILMPSAVRRLTPRECERLQGFPDDYTLTPYRGKPAADGPRYKALGNSMARPCMEWIGRRILALELRLTKAA